MQIKYRIPAAEIFKLSLSPYHDDIAVFHVRAVSTLLYYTVFLFVGVQKIFALAKNLAIKEKSTIVVQSR